MNAKHSAEDTRTLQTAVEEDEAGVEVKMVAEEDMGDATQVLIEAASRSLLEEQMGDEEFPDTAEEEHAGGEDTAPEKGKSSLNAGSSAVDYDKGIGGEKRAYPCPACKQTIHGSVQAIVEHLYQHSKALARVCRECGARTRSASAMFRHVVQHVSSKGNASSRGTHLDELQRLFACVICGSRFKFCGHAKTHMYLHMAEKRYKCKLCNTFFTRKNALRKHTWSSHGRLLPCDQQDEEEGEMNEDSAEAEGTRDEEAEWSSNAAEAFGDESSQKGKGTRCMVCGKHFLSERTLEAHMNTHVNVVVLHDCDFCSKRFTTRTYLRKHRTILHGVRDTGVNQHYICSICNYRFVGTSFFASHLLQHMDSKEERPEQPSTAGREDHAYMREAQVQVGKSTGTGASLSRPVPGQKRPAPSQEESPASTAGPSRGVVSILTGRRYSSVSQTPVTGEGARSATAPQSQGLTQMEVFACPKCQQTFTDESKYSDHMAAHEGRAVVSCYHCPEKFHSQADLETHLATFFGDMAEEARAAGEGDTTQAGALQLEQVTGYCRACKEAFCSIDFLNIHMSTVHANVATYTLVQMPDTSIQGKAVVTAHFAS